MDGALKQGGVRASPLGAGLVAMGLNQESEELGYYLALEA